MSLLRVTGLTKRFGANEVLRGIDLEVRQGERIAILGASGSGKSSLLRCLNFMELPTAGGAPAYKDQKSNKIAHRGALPSFPYPFICTAARAGQEAIWLRGALKTRVKPVTHGRNRA